MTQPANIYAFLKTANELSELEERILYYCYHEGRVTLQQIARYEKEEPDKIHTAIQSLVAKRLLYIYKFQNFEFFELNLPAVKYMRYEKFPSGPVIPLVYQFNLLSDDTRLYAFKESINQMVNSGDIVLDLGCGTGVLSMFAAQKGAFVFAIEVDPIVAEVAEYFIKNNGYGSRIKVIQGDSRNLELDIKADIIICEMLDTALIAELQVPVMNHAIRKWLKPIGKVIPLSAETSAELVNTKYEFGGLDFRLIHYEEYGARVSTYTLSEPLVYHNILFNKENPVDLSTRFSLKAHRSGITNGLRLKTSVMVSDKIKIGGSAWFNPPLILPFDDIRVEEGEEVEISLSYGLGAGFASIKYDVQLVK